MSIHQTVCEMTLYIACKGVVESEELPCLCGQEPYEDGHMCPKCFCLMAIEAADKASPPQGVS